MRSKPGVQTRCCRAGGIHFLGWVLNVISVSFFLGHMLCLGFLVWSFRWPVKFLGSLGCGFFVEGAPVLEWSGQWWSSQWLRCGEGTRLTPEDLLSGSRKRALGGPAQVAREANETVIKRQADCPEWNHRWQEVPVLDLSGNWGKGSWGHPGISLLWDWWSLWKTWS